MLTTDAALNDAYLAYHEANERLTLISMRGIAETIRDKHPLATHLVMGESDQSTSGMQVPLHALTADNEEIDTDDIVILWELTGNLDNCNSSTWYPFATYAKIEYDSFYQLDLIAALAIELP